MRCSKVDLAFDVVYGIRFPGTGRLPVDIGVGKSTSHNSYVGKMSRGDVIKML